MGHALRRSPVDVCELRHEDSVVLGNAGVVEIEEVGPNTEGLAHGDHCLVFCCGDQDPFGYPKTIFGYDQPGSVGLLAKRTVLGIHQLIRLPQRSSLSLRHWAAFSLRYITAFANWRVARSCWRAQMPEFPADQALVFAWGGGVSLAEATLARREGFRVAMATSHPDRAALLRSLGIEPFDRTALGSGKEDELLRRVQELSDGAGAAIVIDHLGANHKLTVRLLARQGVLTTSGWKVGVNLTISRAMECIARHIHVHTHYARRSEGIESVLYAAEHDWRPPIAERTWSWDEIPELARAYEANETDLFPVFSVERES